MKLHELKELNFDEALDLLESRIIEIQRRIQEAESQATDGQKGLVDDLHRRHADLLEQMERLRKLKAEEMAGEKDSLLTEILGIFDLIGNKIDHILSGKSS